MERVKGIEPSSLAWKAIALPLSYTRDFNDLAPCAFCFWHGIKTCLLANDISHSATGFAIA